MLDNPNAEMMKHLYQKYWGTLMRQILGKLKDPDDAETVIVDTVVKATLNYSKIRDKSKEENWIRKIARNEMLAFLKQKEKEKKRRVDSDIDTILYSSRFSSSSAEKTVIDRIEYQRLVEYLRGLPEQSHFILEYRKEGKTYKEISQIMGINEGTLKSIVSRTLSRYNENKANAGGDYDNR